MPLSIFGKVLEWGLYESTKELSYEHHSALSNENAPSTLPWVIAKRYSSNSIIINIGHPVFSKFLCKHLIFKSPARYGNAIRVTKLLLLEMSSFGWSQQRWLECRGLWPQTRRCCAVFVLFSKEPETTLSLCGGGSALRAHLMSAVSSDTHLALLACGRLLLHLAFTIV